MCSAAAGATASASTIETTTARITRAVYHQPHARLRRRELSAPRYGLSVQEEGTETTGFLERLRAGDARAFEELVATHQHRVFGVALRMLENGAEAEEVAQETFLRAHASLAEFRGDAKLSTWLYAIVSRLCLNRLASADRRVIRSGDELLLRVADASGGPDASAERGELEAALHRAIADLPEERRVVVILRDLEGMA